AALSKRRKAVADELSELDQTVEGFRETESFGRARESLTQAAKRHDDAEWVGAVEEKQEALRKSVTSAYAGLKDKALEAKRRDDKVTLEGHRARLVRWKWPEFSSDLEDALAKVVPPPP